MTKLGVIDFERLKVMAKLTQMEADETQRRYSHNRRGHPGRVRASQLQREAAMMRREIKRRRKDG